MNLKNRNALFIMVLCFMGIIIFFNFQKPSINQNYALSEEQYTIEKPNQEIKNSVEIINDQFVQEGNSQDISLYNSRSLEFINESTESEGITVSNPVKGWNMTSFSLNFKNLSTSAKYVKFETRNDGSISFRQDDVYFAMSFKIPNSCILRNISLFVQYPGGRGSQTGGNQKSIFSISIYNASYESDQALPHQNLTKVIDKTHFDLTDENVTQPAKWYEANFFEERILNISETERNTFFAVFKTIDFPESVFGNPDGYLYYANEQTGDLYNQTFYQSTNSLPSTINELSGKNGMLKVNLVPLSTKPNPDEVNLTVFGDNVSSEGCYGHNQFVEHKNDQFDIQIASEWFAPVEYNATFEGSFQYNKETSTIFRTTNSYVIWNSTVEIREYPGDSYDRIARIYNPSHWKYNQTFKDFSNYDSIKNKSGYVDVYGVSNNHNWTVQYLQKNDIISSSIWESQNKKEWISVGNLVNFTNFIKIESDFNNTNGQAWMQVSVDDEIDIVNSQNVTLNQTTFPIWRPDLDTSIKNNESLIKINIFTYNGTIAGLISKTLHVQVFKDPISLSLTSNIKSEYAWGETITLQALLESNNNPLQDQHIYFTIREMYSQENVQVKTLSDTTNSEGLAQVEYEISQVNQLEIAINYNGTLYYQKGEILRSDIVVRSPTVEFLINFTPFIIIVSSVIAVYAAYRIVKKKRFREKQKIWEKKTNIFSDTLSIDYILIINKLSGSNIVQKELGDMQFEAGLVSGFLQAITSFKYELKKEKAVEKARETILLDYQDYKILLKDGEYIRVALVLNQEPSDHLKRSLTKFINDFEMKYKKKLEHFDGEVSVFKDFMELVDIHFNTSLLKPHIVNENPPALETSSFENKVLDIAKTLQQDREKFYISKLLNYLLSAMSEQPKEKIIATVFDLTEKEYLVSIPVQE